METKKLKVPTKIDMTETLQGIKDATDFAELAAEEEGLSIEEYEKREKEKQGYKRKEIKPLKLSDKKETKDDSNFTSVEKNYLESWVDCNIPRELQKESGIYEEVREIFQNLSRRKDFQSIWNCGMSVPKGLTEKSLISYSSKKIGYLEYLGQIDLNSKEIATFKNVSEEIGKMREEIEFLEETGEIPSKMTYDVSEKFFSDNAFFYLKKMVIIKKLKELLAIVNQYESV